MFKKRLTISNTSLLSGKDTKKLRQWILEVYPVLGKGGKGTKGGSKGGDGGKVPLDALLPAKAAVVSQKMAEQRGTIYALESGPPLFFDPDGHQDNLIPTIYTLAAFPALLPVLYTWSPVSPRILGGADLFVQGVLRPPEIPAAFAPSFLAKRVVAVAVPGNPVPFAVGLTCVSSQEAERDGWKGKGVQVLHVWGDLLWKLGGGGPVNAGFQDDGIKPIETRAADGERAEGDGEAQGEPGEGDRNARGGGEGGEGRAGRGSGTGSPESESDVRDRDEEGTRAGEVVDEASSSGSPSVSMDEALETALLAGVKTLKSSDLPIQLSDFYAKYMLPAKPPTLTFDLKASSYKKLSKLVSAFQKKKVLEMKTIRKQECISKVDREHALVGEVEAKLRALALQEQRRQASLVSSAQAAEAAAARGETSDSTVSKDAAAALARVRAKEAETKPQLTLEEVFRLPSALRQALFEPGVAGKPDRDGLVHRDAVDAALRRACYRRRLFRGPSGKPIADEDALARAHAAEGAAEGASLPPSFPPLPPLPRATADDLLRHAILNKGEAFPFDEGVPYPALLSKCLARCTRFVRLVAPWTPLEGVLSRGDPSPVAIAAAKRRGHPVTVVSNVEALGMDPKDVAGELQRRFQASTSVGEFPGAAGVAVVLQGDATAKVAEFFADKYGLPSKFIDVKKTGKKGAKK